MRMNFFKDLSIRSKLIWIMFVISVFSLGISFTFVVLRDVKNFKREMVENTIAIAHLIGDFSIVDLTFRDPKASENTLAILKGLPYINFACVYQEDGKVFSFYARNKSTAKAPVVRSSSFDFQDGFLHVFYSIRQQGKNYGTIYLRASTAMLDSKVKKHFLTMIALMAAVLFLTFLIAMQLQRLISKPILALTEITQKVSEKADYTLRVESDSKDEIGILSQGFNNMLMQIQKRQFERSQALAALQESEERYRNLVETTPEAIFVEQNQKLVYMNPAGLRLLGYSTLELMDQKLEKFIPNYSDLVRATILPIEAKFIRKDGKLLDVELTFFGTIYAGQSAIQCLARDITESKNLRIAAQRMERLAALGELSAMIAHEIRNSLGSISLNFRNLSDHLKVPDPHQRTFNNIDLGIQRIQEIINGILNFARPLQPTLRKVDIRKVIDSSVHTIEKEMESSGIQLMRRYDASLPEVVIDPVQINQVLINLYLNAKQAMRSGGTLTISAIVRSDFVEISVQDTGIGICPENLDKIFNPFFTTRSEGIGLGLAIVSRILEQHKSQIFVESEPGSGTKFIIRFPIKPFEAAFEDHAQIFRSI
jgi:PAS domain S-box-containing protein